MARTRTYDASAFVSRAVELADRLRSLQLRCWFRTMLGDAYVMNDKFDKALVVARKAFEVSTEIQFLLGVGWSKQVLGRIAHAEGAITEATRNFNEAIEALEAIGARFELARTYLELAKLAKTTGDSDALRSKLRT